MYAVIETGGKQYRVEVGTELEVELLDVVPGDTIALDRILLIADGEKSEIGRPIVQNASVAAEVVRQARGVKTISFKYRPKARSRVKKGHRQELTVLRISDIVLDGKSAAADVVKAADAKMTERQRVDEAARRQAEADAAIASRLAAAAAAKASKAPPKAAAAPKAAPAPKAAKAAAAPKAAKAAAAPKAAKAAAAPKAVKAVEAAPAPKTTKPRTAKAAPAAADAPAEKPKRARATKKDE